ncbi:MAG: hypothetical protein H6739_18700 [Alphaproteobacteria bacterium]|nr:hypothetical protein [Alphaproteobacteria bacterium]
MTEAPPTAQALFQQHDLPWIPLPGDLERSLRAVSPFVWSTREPLPATPYDLDVWVEEVLDDPAQDYALIGHAGHGVNSWALHIYCARGPLALFLQVGFGGAYQREADTRKVLGFLAERCGPLLTRADACAGGPVRVVLVVSGLSGVRWRLTEPGAAWQEEGDPYAAAAAALR